MGYDFLGLSRCVDFVVPMVYDMTGLTAPGHPTASANSPLGAVSESVRQYLRLGILPSQLVLHVRLLELVLEQHFQRDDVLASLLARQVHVAELAAAQRLTDVEVAYLFIVGSGGRRCGASG